MKLADNLRIIRKEHNLSQEQLAEKLGVSRQAVSKWESGQSYPEMDKVLLICKLFNYNIDELMNENVKEVNETEQSKININKYIEDFFSFITKTVDMLSSMKLKVKLKCFFEQIAIMLFLLALFVVMGLIGNEVLHGIIGGLPSKAYYLIRNLFSSIYIVLALVLGIIIVLHIFKVRYLDYYEIVKEENLSNEVDNVEESIKDDEKIVLEKKKERIIIRDPKHSGYKFLSGILRIVLWCIKFVVACVAIGFALTFIGLVSALILTFVFVKTGLVFVGAFLGILSALIINFIVLKLSYNFIISKKTHKTRLAILLLISFILAGVSIGSALIGTTQFELIDEVNDIEEEFEIKMTDDLIIDSYNFEYVETESKDIEIVAKYSKYFDFELNNENNEIMMWFYQDSSKIMELIRDNISDINNKEIKNYYHPKIYLYTSKSNIEKIRENRQLKYQEQRRVEEIHETNYRLENEVMKLKDEIIEKDNVIEMLNQQIKELNNN